MTVLDASAVLAWLQGEVGAEVVEPLLDDAVMSAANWSEVLQKAWQHGRDADRVGVLLHAMGVSVEPVVEEDARTAARLWSEAAHLSLADGLCLVLAQRLGGQAVTAERSWVAVAPETLVIR